MGGRQFGGQRQAEGAEGEAALLPGQVRNIDSQQESYQNNMMMNSQVGNQGNY